MNSRVKEGGKDLVYAGFKEAYFGDLIESLIYHSFIGEWKKGYKLFLEYEKKVNLESRFTPIMEEIAEIKLDPKSYLKAEFLKSI